MSDGTTDPPADGPDLATTGSPGEPADAAPDLTLDALGLRCPQPVTLLARRIGEVPVGSVVEVVCDDPVASVDIPAWCHLRRHDYLGAREAPGGTGHLVRRREG